MLILTRKIEESIIIDGDIEVKVLAYDRGQVKLGVTAPDNVVIDREEIHNIRYTEHWKD